ncbi:MAG: substrate-binding domain-containing protein [Succinivibrionaceae bacterium]|nr:substrate-binding domain-containing protein [Succinivibrionaceae bacterium]
MAYLHPGRERCSRHPASPWAALTTAAALALPQPALAIEGPAPGFAACHANVFYYSLGSGKGFLSLLRAALEDEASRHGISVSAYDAKGSSQEQIKQVDQRAGGSDPIIFNAVDDDSALFALNHARDHRLPIIFFHRESGEKIYGKYDHAYFVGTNRRMCGIYQAELLQSYIKDNPGYDRNHNGKVDYLLVMGPEGNADAVERTSAFKGAMEATGHSMALVGAGHCGWDRARAAEFVLNALRNYPVDALDAVIANNDAMALGALDVLQGKGYNLSSQTAYIPVVGADGIDEAITAIAQGSMLGSVFQDYRLYASAIMGLLAELSEGHTGNTIVEENIGLQMDERRITVPYSVIDQQRAIALGQHTDNIDEDSLHYQ